MRRTTSHSDRQRGFTLAEILVTTAIFAIIMIAALTVYDKSNKVFKSSSEAADLQQSTRIGFDKLLSEVRMAGFDYSRGGVPTKPAQFAQPDEQIEYAGSNVIAFRSNLDYVTNAANGNGLAPPAYTRINPATNLPYFPFITTTNDEILVYALRSADASANTGSISFWTDAAIPRSAYPGTGGAPETRVTVSGIDTTNDHPPYTLYRMTVTDILNGSQGTPIADNLRSLNFSYFSDTKGSKPLTDASNGAITVETNADGTTVAVPAGSGAIGGAGQYDPSNIGATSHFNDRNRRSMISSIRVNVVGMNAIPDQNYQNPTETNPSFQNYREYQLQALVVPRNLGLTGFPEPNYGVPGTPTIDGICTAFCGAPVVCWTPSSAGGAIDKFTIAWDTNPQGSFANTFDIYDATATFAILPDDGVSDVSQTRYYQITAVNDNGSSYPSAQVTAQPLESTKPLLDSGSGLVATDPSHLNAQANQITLSWTSPSANVSAQSSMSCTGSCSSVSTATIPPQEVQMYEIYRSTNPTTLGTTVVAFGSARGPVPSSPGAPVTFVDSPTTSDVPPAACVQYYYRIRMASRCAKNNLWNKGGNKDTYKSDIYPPVGSAGIPGYATSTSTPAAPIGLAVDTANSNCPGSGNCTIKLGWNKTTTDTGGNAIVVDTYRITRSRKRIIDPTYTADPNFTPLDVSGYSQSSTGTGTWTDTTAPAYDSCGSCSGLPWYYQYTVAAKVCSTYSAESNTAVYPLACSVNPVIVEAGGTGSGTGDSPANAWIFNTGDTITVTASSGTLSSVEFIVTAYPSGTTIDDSTIAPANATVSGKPAFVYTWGNLSQGTYRVVIRATNASNCVENDVRYVTEQTPAGCAFAALTSPPTVPSPVKAGGNDKVSIDYTFTNASTSDDMQLNITSSPTFQGVASLTWKDPDGSHGDMNLTSVQWTIVGGAQSTDNTVDPPSGSIGTATRAITRNVPSALTTVPKNNGKLTMRFTFTYNGGNGNKSDPDLTTTPIQKLCLAYRIPSEPGVTKFCNLAGQAASTNNPNACD